MANFVLLYTGGSMPASEAEQKKNLQEWQGWYGKLGSALVDGGHPFVTSKIRNIERDGTVRDGPVDRCLTATGYSIIKADSLNRAVELAKTCPVLRDGGQISVYEASAMM